MGMFLSEERKGKFTASNIAALMYEKGKSTAGFETLCYEKASERLDIMLPSEFINDAIVHGNENEPMAIMAFEMLTGCKVSDTGSDSEFIQYGENAGCTPDGKVYDSGICIAGVEAKCPFNPVHFLKQYMLKDTEALKKYKKDYYWQVQSGMLFSGLDLWHFVTYHPEYYQKHRVIGHLEVKANEKDHELIISRLKDAEIYTDSIVQAVLNKKK